MAGHTVRRQGPLSQIQSSKPTYHSSRPKAFPSVCTTAAACADLVTATRSLLHYQAKLTKVRLAITRLPDILSAGKRRETRNYMHPSRSVQFGMIAIPPLRHLGPFLFFPHWSFQLLLRNLGYIFKFRIHNSKCRQPGENSVADLP